MNVVKIDKSPTGGDTLLTLLVCAKAYFSKKNHILLHHAIQLKVILGTRPLVNMLNLAWLMNCDQRLR
jgi:hypothetical protein